MDFVNRKEERAFLDRRHAVAGFRFVPLYGRRMVGKTRLVQEFMLDKAQLVSWGARSGRKGRYGLLSLAEKPVCSFFDGSFHSSTRRPNLAQLEEALIELDTDPPSGMRSTRSFQPSSGHPENGTTAVPW